MVDRLFSEPSLTEWYDILCAGRVDFDFYLPLVMSARSVLDVGCGTGELLRRAREAGHTGRLCGLDPAEAMLAHARRRSDVEWVPGDLASVAWEGEFDLVVMTGHAFQVFVTDEELRVALTAARRALTDGGRFAFETRNPAVRAWERWTASEVFEFGDSAGRKLRYWREAQTPVVGDTVTFRATFDSDEWDRPQPSWSTLRFLDADEVASRLVEAGFVIEERFGDFGGGRLTDGSPEIVIVARR
jgi:SAM-dependent methyltransferase